MIELKSVSKVFQTKDIETRAFDEMCLKINSSEFVSIMGPSGCGKKNIVEFDRFAGSTDCRNYTDT